MSFYYKKTKKVLRNPEIIISSRADHCNASPPLLYWASRGESMKKVCLVLFLLLWLALGLTVSMINSQSAGEGSHGPVAGEVGASQH
jgi:hypothetical protein